MSESGIFLDYHGAVDLSVIELLLVKLKKTKEFGALNKITSKRTYALAVECLENIYKHSALKSSDDQRMLPHISVKEKNDKIIIVAGNPVSFESKDKLVRRLDHLNQSDEAALKTMHENIIRSDLKQNANGAGLGLIFMAMKSGNTIKYSFNPLTSNYLYFEIQISLNKYIMRKLIIDQTPNSPKVILDPEKKIYHISGESRPPDVREFYDQILSWLDDFSIYLVKSDDMKDPVIFNFNFEYFNSSSGKLILDICKILAGLQLKGFNVTINWHFEKDDVDMLEVGKEMSKIVKFPFEYIES
ncbi:MAG TPA: SiaC family regulatory phosphoprotein [Bacteroidales bacterium]|nr:SiaC family regulatory phosphoprotein [Bacteroidales bacterium]